MFLLTTIFGFLASRVAAIGYRTVASSGVAPQMAFLPPWTTKIVFIDKFHPNYGYPTVDLQNGVHEGNEEWEEGNNPVFGAEFDLSTYDLRALQPLDDTSCSIGAFLQDGTLVNIAGTAGKSHIHAGFTKTRTYAPGPCSQNDCTQDWNEEGTLSTRRWYPSAQVLPDGNILVVGGASRGFLVLNEASINVPSYEIISNTTLSSTEHFSLPILEFSENQNLEPGYSYNMYPILHLLPNSKNPSEIMTVAGNRSIVWDYVNHKKAKSLPDTPKSARTFPSSATSVLLPLVAPHNTPEVLVCGGSSDDIPNPLTMNDCYTIKPYDHNPRWNPTDNLPNGGQTMSNGILLPDSTVIILNGARKGSAGGLMAENPVYTPVLYNHSAANGQRFKSLQGTSIPRLYHSVAILIPTGQVLVAGSNTFVTYSAKGQARGKEYPKFTNNGHQCALQRQQNLNSSYPTEYRVEIFDPPYMDKPRPVITKLPQTIKHNAEFTLTTTMQGKSVNGDVSVALIHPGFSTHAQNQGQRMAKMLFKRGQGDSLVVTAPHDGSVMPAGQYLLWVVVDGVPSTGEWISLLN